MPAFCAGQLNEAELENQTLKATLEDAQQRHQQAVVQTEVLTASLTTHQSTLAGYTSQVEELQLKVQTVQQQLNEATDKEASKQTQLQELTAEHQSLSMSLRETQV